MIDWDHLKVVLEVSRAGSLTGAALLLEMDQTTAGRRLSALEEQLETRLFLRAKTGFLPTDDGIAGIDHALRVEAEIARMSDALAEARHCVSGVVRLSGNGWMLDRLAETVLGDVLARNEGMEIRMNGRLPPVPLFPDPGIALWFDAEAHAPERAHPFCTVPYAVYRAANGPTAEGAWVQFRDDLATGPSFRRQVTRRMPKGARVRLTATDAGTLLSAVAAGVGQGTLPVCLGDADPRLVAAEVPDARIDRVLHLYASDDVLRLPRVRHLVKGIAARAAEVLGGRLLADVDRLTQAPT